MNKKVLSVLLSAVMSVSLLAGCSKTEESEESSKGGSYEAATTEDVKTALSDENSIVLDARMNDAYIGWAVDGAKRGGHIKGASDFSAAWIDCEYDDKENLEGETREQVLTEAMKNKDITEDKKVIVYDTNGEDATKVADYLSEKGVKDVSTYDANEWINDESLEMESYPNYQMLVPASVVNEIANGKTPEGFTKSKDIKIVDIRWGNNEESGYLEGHIPTAIHVNTDSFEPPTKYVNDIEEWRLADDETLAKLLLENGITKDTCVIATSPEPMAASRFAVICKYMGVEDVRVMNGGFVDWNKLGLELSKDEEKAEPATDFGVAYPANPDWIETLEQVKKDIKDTENFTLVDNRTWEEFIGEETGYSYHKIAGRIEGAVFGYAGKKDSSSVSYYRNIDKSMRNADEIKAMWKECGIDTNKRLAFMCGSGWRAAEILWYAKVMGFENTTLYSDGWIAWSNEGNPYITGEPEK